MKTAWFSGDARRASPRSARGRPHVKLNRHCQSRPANRTMPFARSTSRGQPRQQAVEALLIERDAPSGRRSSPMPSSCRWSRALPRARSRYVATPVANRTSLSIAPRTVRKRSARGLSRASRVSTRAARRLVDQIELVHHQEVGRLDLRASRPPSRAAAAVDVGGVDHRDDGVEPEPGALDAVGERLGIGQPGRLDDDEVRLRGLDDLLDREVEAVVVDRAADAAARQLDHLLDRRQAGDRPGRRCRSRRSRS